MTTFVERSIEDENFLSLLDESGELIWDILVEVPDQTSGGRREGGLPYRRPVELPPPVAFSVKTGQGDQSVDGELDIELGGVFSESSSLAAEFEGSLEIVGSFFGHQFQRLSAKASLAMLGRARSSQAMLVAAGNLGQEIIVKNLSGGEPEETPRYFGGELDPALWPDD